MKKALTFLVLLFLFPHQVFSQTVNPDNILGLWESNLIKGHVEIMKEGDIYRGKLVWLKSPDYPDGTPKWINIILTS